jgi:hypothetical protein
MKTNDLVKPHGCYVKNKQTGKLVLYIPEYVEDKIHRVAKTRQTLFGLLIKTDRHPDWINSGWFKKVN